MDFNFENFSEDDKKRLYKRQEAKLADYEDCLGYWKDPQPHQLRELRSWTESNFKRYVRFDGPEMAMFIQTINYFRHRSGVDKKRWFAIDVTEWQVV